MKLPKLWDLYSLNMTVILSADFVLIYAKLPQAGQVSVESEKIPVKR